MPPERRPKKKRQGKRRGKPQVPPESIPSIGLKEAAKRVKGSIHQKFKRRHDIETSKALKRFRSSDSTRLLSENDVNAWIALEKEQLRAETGEKFFRASDSQNVRRARRQASTTMSKMEAYEAAKDLLTKDDAHYQSITLSDRHALATGISDLVLANLWKGMEPIGGDGYVPPTPSPFDPTIPRDELYKRRDDIINNLMMRIVTEYHAKIEYIAKERYQQHGGKGDGSSSSQKSRSKGGPQGRGAFSEVDDDLESLAQFAHQGWLLLRTYNARQLVHAVYTVVEALTVVGFLSTTAARVGRGEGGVRENKQFAWAVAVFAGPHLFEAMKYRVDSESWISEDTKKSLLFGADGVSIARAIGRTARNALMIAGDPISISAFRAAVQLTQSAMNLWWDGWETMKVSRKQDASTIMLNLMLDGRDAYYNGASFVERFQAEYGSIPDRFRKYLAAYGKSVDITQQSSRHDSDVAAIEPALSNEHPVPDVVIEEEQKSVAVPIDAVEIKVQDVENVRIPVPRDEINSDMRMVDEISVRLGIEIDSTRISIDDFDDATIHAMQDMVAPENIMRANVHELQFISSIQDTLEDIGIHSEYDTNRFTDMLGTWIDMNKMADTSLNIGVLEKEIGKMNEFFRMNDLSKMGSDMTKLKFPMSKELSVVSTDLQQYDEKDDEDGTTFAESAYAATNLKTEVIVWSGHHDVRVQFTDVQRQNEAAMNDIFTRKLGAQELKNVQEFRQKLMSKGGDGDTTVNGMFMYHQRILRQAQEAGLFDKYNAVVNDASSLNYALTRIGSEAPQPTSLEKLGRNMVNVQVTMLDDPDPSGEAVSRHLDDMMDFEDTTLSGEALTPSTNNPLLPSGGTTDATFGKSNDFIDNDIGSVTFGDNDIVKLTNPFNPFEVDTSVGDAIILEKHHLDFMEIPGEIVQSVFDVTARIATIGWSLYDAIVTPSIPGLGGESGKSSAKPEGPKATYETETREGFTDNDPIYESDPPPPDPIPVVPIPKKYERWNSFFTADNVKEKKEQEASIRANLRPFLAIAGTDAFDQQSDPQSEALKASNLLMGMVKPVNWPLANTSNPMWISRIAMEGVRYSGELNASKVYYEGGSLTEGDSLYGTVRDRMPTVKRAITSSTIFK
jgi:hypothetical protein